MTPDGFHDLTQAEVHRMCEQNMEELAELRRERNQSYQWRPVEWVCKCCGNGGCVEVPHVSYPLTGMIALPGASAIATVEDHAEKYPECESPRIEFRAWS